MSNMKTPPRILMSRAEGCVWLCLRNRRRKRERWLSRAAMSSSFQPALQRLRKLLPEGEVLLDPESRARYAGDKWFATNTPDAVVLPASTTGVSALLKFASRNKLPVT